MTTKQEFYPPEPASEPLHELTRQEIDESINTSQAVVDLISKIRDAEYPSEIKDINRSLPRFVLDNGLTPAEVDVLATVISEEMKKRKITDMGSFALSESDIVPKIEWSPSDVLDRMPDKNKRDWAERAANDRHDKEE